MTRFQRFVAGSAKDAVSFWTPRVFFTPAKQRINIDTMSVDIVDTWEHYAFVLPFLNYELQHLKSTPVFSYFLANHLGKDSFAFKYT